MEHFPAFRWDSKETSNSCTSESKDIYAANEICNLQHERLLEKPRLKRMSSCADLSNSYTMQEGSQAL